MVMLYAHYDVQPAPPEQGWTTDPWTPTTARPTDGSTGVAPPTTRAGWSIHLGTMRILEGKPPCTIRLIVEGMEETASNLEAFVDAHPDLFDCDLFIVCDMGNLRVGEPVLTTALRGDVACIVTVRTLEHPLHSGLFGGAAPDAMMALARLLATLVDDDGQRGRRRGDDAVNGTAPSSVPRSSWSSADLLRGRPASSAPVPSRRDSGRSPSINAIGVDMTSIAGSSNVLVPEARAKISMRIVPGSEPEKELDALVSAPRGARARGGREIEVKRTKEAPGFRCKTDGPATPPPARRSRRPTGSRSATRAPAAPSRCFARSRRPRRARSSSCGVPKTSPAARIHASDESVDPSEIEKMVVAQVLLIQRFAER